MKRFGQVLCVCAVLAALSVSAAEAPDNAAMADELKGLKEANEQLLQRITALEEKVGQGGVTVEKKSSVPPGRIDLGGGVTLKIKGDVRIRNEEMRNTFDYNNRINDNWNSTRLRTRLGFDADYDNTMGAYVQLANEYRWGTKTEYNYTGGGAFGGFGTGNALDLAIDNAYVRLNFEKMPGSLPILLTAGRQDLLAFPERGWRGMYGEGWLFFDGTPFDGSTTISFDSIKTRLVGKSAGLGETTTIDFIFAKPADFDEAGPRQRHSTAYRDEDAYVLYGITREIEPLQTELYAMHRNKNRAIPIFAIGKEDPKLQTTVLGGRLSTAKPFADGRLSWALEGAYQFGSLHPQNAIGGTPYPAKRVRRNAFGFYTWLRGVIKEVETLKPTVTARFDYMSGDDPNTSNQYEGWDSFYAEWPKYSELMIYKLWDGFGGLTQNPNLGSFTNMYFPTLEVQVSPSAVPGLGLKGGFRYMLADEKNGGGSSRKIGDLWQFLATYNLGKSLRTHFYFDYMNPGSYYRPNDDAWFARVELWYLFN